MAKLHQLIAIVNGKKSRALSAMTGIHHKLQKSEPLNGIARSYKPRDDNGEKLPDESTRVQVRVRDMIKEAAAIMTDSFDCVATMEKANCRAVADVKVGDTTVLPGIPVATLLFLEKQLVDVYTFVSKLPTLDLANQWDYSSEADCFATPPHLTTKTKKVQKAQVLYEATKEHPAQVSIFTEDVVAGDWTTTKFSGAIPESERNKFLGRVVALQEAVKKAREEANSIDAPDVPIGKQVFDFVFGQKQADAAKA